MLDAGRHKVNKRIRPGATLARQTKLISFMRIGNSKVCDHLDIRLDFGELLQLAVHRAAVDEVAGRDFRCPMFTVLILSNAFGGDTFDGDALDAITVGMFYMAPNDSKWRLLSAVKLLDCESQFVTCGLHCKLCWPKTGPKKQPERSESAEQRRQGNLSPQLISMMSLIHTNLKSTSVCEFLNANEDIKAMVQCPKVVTRFFGEQSSS